MWWRDVLKELSTTGGVNTTTIMIIMIVIRRRQSHSLETDKERDRVVKL